MNWLRSWISRSPRRALMLGKAVFLAGAILVLGAVFARAGLVIRNGERAESKLPALQTLAEAFPQLPTWVVPEGPIGYTIAALLVLVGMGVTVLAEKQGGRR